MKKLWLIQIKMSALETPLRCSEVFVLRIKIIRHFFCTGFFFKFWTLKRLKNKDLLSWVKTFIVYTFKYHFVRWCCRWVPGVHICCLGNNSHQFHARSKQVPCVGYQVRLMIAFQDVLMHAHIRTLWDNL